MKSISKGESLTIEITDLNNLGCGVGRAPDGRAVFVKGAVSGDTVVCQVIKVNKSFLAARLVTVVNPSPHRCPESFCSAPLACGGCVYRHITYSHELELKQSYVKNAFKKAGLPHVTVLPTRSTGKISGYRNKGQFPVTMTKNGIKAGFFASKTHNIIPSDECMIQNEAFLPIVRAVTEFADRKGWSVYDEVSGKGLLRHIYLRIGEATGEIMLCLVINGENIPDSESFVAEMTSAFPNITGILLSINKKNTNVVLGNRFITLHGNDYIEDRLCNLRFRVSADSFYQVNREGAELLYGLAKEAAGLKGGEVLMDLYCGTGTIGLSMAESVRKLCGVEIVEAAVECAKENAQRNGIKNAEFFCADAGNKEVILNAAGGVRPDVVVIDPPRKGSTKELVDCLAALEVPKVVYVSCDPDTLARDCAWFSTAGYEIGEVTPVDMFPRTGHVESLVCLQRQTN
ncbi:MAG: 23S rRNA (uracil(1939)-C(5))-methyltransferase RlmD [Clostridia bacterium]|nr:23S rRNA (uracil(1939)-C(5))-methyltransferase RlmD [Clostridia bacterium]